MARHFGSTVLIVAILFCLLTTISAGFNPERFGEQIGLRVIGPGGVNEIRAQYAGFFLAVAVVCVASLAGALPRRTAFITLAAVFGGLIVGRLVSLGLNGGVGGYEPTIRALFPIDAIGLALAVVAAVFDGAGEYESKPGQAIEPPFSLR
jgi:uncharacterized membrane protein YkvI